MSGSSGKPGSKRKATVRLNIRTNKELRRFLRAILPEFLRVVDPRESGFVDVLYANEVITQSDNSSLSGKDVMTRKDQARKLFILLNKVPVQKFLNRVAPELCEMFPHIIPEEFKDTDDIDDSADDTDDPDDVCLVHIIQQRIRPATMADMLYHEGFLTLEEYTAITELSRKKESIWPTLLKKFKLRSRHERRILLKVLIKLLKQYYIEVPSNIKDQLSCGLPCTCPEPPKPPSGSSPEFMSKNGRPEDFDTTSTGDSTNESNAEMSDTSSILSDASSVSVVSSPAMVFKKRRGLGTRRTPTAESRNKEAADNALRLNLRTDDDLKEFMRAILPDFLGAVSPREDGFIDMLYSADVLTETDNESLSGKDVRNRTEQSVAAELCQRYPHIIPKRFIVTTKTEAGTNRSLTRDKQTVDKCLRHAIQSGIRVKQVADTLFHTDLICYETYSKISFDKIEEEKAWTEIFAAFRDCSEDEDKHLLSLLRANHVLFVPEELEDMRKQ
ncbi:hypothetical protein BaRGS_00036729, partial [Batillaria attramentaria]